MDELREPEKPEMVKEGDMSNRSLAMLLAVTIVLSILSLGVTMTSISRLTHIEVTGLAAGTVNLSVSASAACNVDANVSFDNGAPTRTIVLSTNADYGAATMSFENCSLSSSTCYEGMQINNTGNSNLIVNFTSDKNASGMLDVTAPLTNFQYYLTNGTLKGQAAPGCSNSSMPGNGTVNSTGFTMLVCNNLSYVNGYDIVSIGFNLTVNETTPKTGQRAAALTINCGQY